MTANALAQGPGGSSPGPAGAMGSAARRIDMGNADKAWERFQAAINANASKARDAETLSSQWLAEGNEAMASGKIQRAVKCFSKSQFWRDRYNRLTGRGA